MTKVNKEKQKKKVGRPKRKPPNLSNQKTKKQKHPNNTSLHENSTVKNSLIKVEGKRKYNDNFIF